MNFRKIGIFITAALMTFAVTLNAYSERHSQKDKNFVSPQIPANPNTGLSTGQDFAPDRIIVTYANSSALAATRTSLAKIKKSSNAQLDASQALLKKYAVKELTPLVADPHAGASITAMATGTPSCAQRIQALKATAATPLPDVCNIVVLQLGQGSALEAVKDFSKDATVTNVQLDYKYKANDIDTMSLPWGISTVRAPLVWNQSKGQGDGVVVAIVDSGVDYNHPDIKDNIWTNPKEIPDNGKDDDGNGLIDDVHGYDFTTYAYCAVNYDYAHGEKCPDVRVKSPDNDPMDGNGHGTHVAGTIAASGGPKGMGIKGVAPHAKIMPLKALTDEGYGYTSQLTQAILYAASNGAQIINNSWGPGNRNPHDSVTETAVHFATSLGKIVVFAAGNSSDDVMYYSPANLSDVITVSAVDQSDSSSFDSDAWFSNYGARIDVAAPGTNILSLNARGGDNFLAKRNNATGDYMTLSGTSMAAPHVSGAIAIILAQHPRYSLEDVRKTLRSSAIDVGTPGFDIYTGYGRLDVKNDSALSVIPKVSIDSPAPNAYITLSKVLNIKGNANGENFKNYSLSYAVGSTPEHWTTLVTKAMPVVNGTLYSWDISQLKPESYWIKLEVTLGNLKSSVVQPLIFENPLFKRIPIDESIASIASEGSLDCKGGKCVWMMALKGQNVWQAYYYDVTNHPGSSARLSNSKLYKGGDIGMRLTNPHISQSKVLWEENNGGFWQLTTVDLDFQRGAAVGDPSEGISWAALDNDKIVYESYKGNAHTIKTFDYATRTSKTIIDIPLYLNFLTTANNIAVWEDSRYQYKAPGGTIYNLWNIYAYDLKTKKLTKVFKDEDLKNHMGLGECAFDGRYIVYTDWIFGKTSIKAYDLSTNTDLGTISGPDQSSLKYHLSISQGRLTWMDDRLNPYDRWDVYVYDIAKKKETLITSDSAQHVDPVIDGNNVYWMDYRNGKDSIYYYTLPN